MSFGFKKSSVQDLEEQKASLHADISEYGQKLDEIKKTFEERLPFYQKADIQVDGEISVNQLLWLLEAYN